jgi:hypothetical protein
VEGGKLVSFWNMHERPASARLFPIASADEATHPMYMNTRLLPCRRGSEHPHDRDGLARQNSKDLVQRRGLVGVNHRHSHGKDRIPDGQPCHWSRMEGAEGPHMVRADASRRLWVEGERCQGVLSRLRAIQLSSAERETRKISDAMIRWKDYTVDTINYGAGNGVTMQV